MLEVFKLLQSVELELILIALYNNFLSLMHHILLIDDES